MRRLQLPHIFIQTDHPNGNPFAVSTGCQDFMPMIFKGHHKWCYMSAIAKDVRAAQIQSWNYLSLCHMAGETRFKPWYWLRTVGCIAIEKQIFASLVHDHADIKFSLTSVMNSHHYKLILPSITGRLLPGMQAKGTLELMQDFFYAGGLKYFYIAANPLHRSSYFMLLVQVQLIDSCHKISTR